MSPSTSRGLLSGADESKEGHENIFGRKGIRSLGPFMFMLVCIQERTCQSKTHADQQPSSNHSKVQMLRRFRQLCLTFPHQEASVSEADNVYFRKAGSESPDSSYNRMNGLVFFLLKRKLQIWSISMSFTIENCEFHRRLMGERAKPS